MGRFDEAASPARSGDQQPTTHHGPTNQALITGLRQSCFAGSLRDQHPHPGCFVGPQEGPGSHRWSLSGARSRRRRAPRADQLTVIDLFSDEVTGGVPVVTTAVMS